MSSPWKAKLDLLSGFLWSTIFVPGGVSGVALKSKFPNKDTYADRFGFTLEVQSKFNVIIAWGMSLSHSPTGKLGSTDARPARNCFLVQIACSAAFR